MFYHPRQPSPLSPRVGLAVLAAVMFMILALENGVFPVPASPASESPPAQAVQFAPEFAASTETRIAFISGWYDGRRFENRRVEYSMVNGLPLFEGDILLDLNGPYVTPAGSYLKSEQARWHKGVIPYEIDPKLPNQQRIHDAIAHWEEHTSLRFVERERNRHPDYVRFQPSFGCSSYVGMIGGMQPINLAPGCSTGNTIHEIGHAVGLWHEQSRIDRDEYVTIQWDNIMRGFEFNFTQRVDDGVDSGEYDYGSIMHYPRWAFSRNGRDTITPLRDGAAIGQRDSLSAGDIAAVEAMYAE